MLRGFALALSWLMLVAPCAAQEVEGNGKNGHAVFSNANYAQVSVPLMDRIQINAYGFYLGNIDASVALIEVPVSVQRHFSVTPSYLYINVPTGGLALLTGAPASSTYRENQLRLAGTFATTFRHFVLSDRNMYVRRFAPVGQVNRYRNRIYISHPLAFGSYKVTPFVLDEVYHDFVPQKWLRRNWFAAGVDMPINGYLVLQLSFIRQDDLQLRSVNFMGIGLNVRTPKVFGRSEKASTN